MQTIYYDKYQIQAHSYILGATSKGLAFVGSWDDDLNELKRFYPKSLVIKDQSKVEPYYQALKQYLTGQRINFDLPLDIAGTDFQEAVWRQLTQIPYGQTSDYSQVAQAIKRPKAIRAVGTAVGKNPVLIVIPCHRVLTKEGKLGGYRGGVAMKQALLNLEDKSTQ